MRVGNLPGFCVQPPGSGMIMCAPVSVCHQVSTIWHRFSSLVCHLQGRHAVHRRLEFREETTRQCLCARCNCACVR